MCNAWNHPPDCTCGWGGEGHLGRSSGWHAPSPAIPHTFGRHATARYETYVNPNARCPVCGAAVFFYQSPEGGRVFFDELGPPWPKHPCTDHRPTTGFRMGAQAARPEQRLLTGGVRLNANYRWHRAGWQPLVIHSVASDTPELLRIVGHLQGTSELTLYVLKRQVGALGDPRKFVEQSLVQAQRIASSRYRLALFTPALRALEIMGYEWRIEASNAAEQLRREKGRRGGHRHHQR